MHVVVVEMNVQIIFQHVDVNVAQVFTMQYPIVLMLNNVQILVLANLVMHVHRQIQSDVVMVHIVQNEIVS
jgi:hypothetical protein